MRLRDGVSGPAAKAASALGKIAKAEEAMVAQSKRLVQSTEALGGFRKLEQQLQGTTQRFHQQQAAVKELGQQLLSASGDTRKLQESFKSAEATLEQTRRAMQRQKTAVAEVSASFEKLSGARLNSAASAESHLRKEIEATSSAMERQIRQAGRFRRTRQGVAELGRNAARSGAGIFLEYEALEGAKKVAETYREFDKARRYGKVVMGLTDEQQSPLVQQAVRGGATTKFNDIQWLESQRELASRGYSLQQVQAFTPITAQLGQAFDVTMPEAVKALEGAMLGFKKDTSTFAKAMEAAQRTADLEVKASKISGMNFEDVTQLYKYAAAPAQMGHLSEEHMLAFGAIGKKANMGGDESGVAFRALMTNLMSPTSGARTAMMAAGIDFGKYQTAPKAMNLPGFTSEVARRYGVRLDGKTQAGLGQIFGNQAMLGDASRFTPAVTGLLRDSLGGKDAKSLKSIAGLARSYRDASVGGVDTNGLMTAVMTAISKNPALSNSIFGSKQGGRIFAALGDPQFYGHTLDELRNQSQGFAGKVSEERMAGFDGAVSRFEGSVKNLETAVGRALDNDGKGGLLTSVTNMAGEFTQKLAEANPLILQLGTAAAGLGATFIAWEGLKIFKSGFGMSAAATQLEASAIALQDAAVSLGGKGVLSGATSAAAGGVGSLGLLGGMALGGAAAGMLGAGALAGKMNMPMVDEFGRPIGNWGGASGGIDMMKQSTGRAHLSSEPQTWWHKIFGSASDSSTQLKSSFAELDANTNAAAAALRNLAAITGGGSSGTLAGSAGSDTLGGLGGSSVATAGAGKTGGVNGRLLAMIHRASDIAGVPLSVQSGFRSAAHNAAVGGARHSLHTLGLAADLASPGHGKGDSTFWRRVNGAMAQASREQGQPYRWGGTFGGRYGHDNNHFDLGPGGAGGKAKPHVTYSPTLNFHHHGGGDLDHDQLAEIVAQRMHAHLERALESSFADV